jgi:signal peptidase I
MLLMRNCLGENYQIPTGSMAPTLQGRHMDVLCEKCGYQYRTGASIENEEHGPRRGEVIGTTCPICRFPMDLDKQSNPNHRSFSGDRIIVSKLAYWMAEPERWDVIVFKCPADAKINYIKRLIGLPGELLVIRHGDIYVVDPATAALPNDQQRLNIARKPPEKIRSMLQVVDDTRYIPPQLTAAGWPSRWIATSPLAEKKWRQNDTGSEFGVEAGDQDSWLRYRHLVPRSMDWARIQAEERLDLSQYRGSLITDYYAYNDALGVYHYSEAINWVGDLALECRIDVVSSQGELLLDLVEGGTHFQCRIDVATGRATLSASGTEVGLQGTPSAVTPIRGPGRHDLRFANVDDQLVLWVDNEVVEFDTPTTFDPGLDVTPRWSAEDDGDLTPVGIGARGATVHVSYLKVLRDVYYLAISAAERESSDYSAPDPDEIQRVLSDPVSWATTDVFRSRREVRFVMNENQFFPLGDNSPESKDARLWSYVLDGKVDPPAAVDRELMIGKAVYVYWPHGWYLPLPGGKGTSSPESPPRRRRFSLYWPIVPNYQRMGFIR